MEMISGLKELRSFGLGNTAIRIAVLDGPVDDSHSCFSGKVGSSVEPSSISDGVIPSSNLALNHGTAVASLIFGNTGSSVEGVAPNCSSILIPIYGVKKNGDFKSSSQLDLSIAIESALEQGANIINISGGEYSKSGDPESFLKQAIEKCHKAGVLIVAAAGNDGCYCLHVPAADEQVLAVGSLDENGQPTPETNFGVDYQKNGILVNGKGLTAAKAGGGTFITGGGTSYATPVASGIIGLLMSLQISEGHEPNAYAIKSIIEHTAIPCVGDGEVDCRRFLRGTLNLPAVLAEIKNNPGVLASGIESKQITKQITMKEKTTIEPSASTVVNESLEGSHTPDSTMSEAVHTEVAPSSELTSSHNVDSEEVTRVPESEQSNVTPNSTINTINSENTMENQETQVISKDQVTIAPSITPSGEVDPSDCGCDGKSEGPRTIYALGTLGYDFGSESHRDSFTQSMGGGNPYDPATMLEYLKANPWEADDILWTLNIDATPIYRLIPAGPFAPAGYERMINFLEAQQNGSIERISIPGLTKGDSELQNGQKVLNLFPKLRGTYAWTTDALVSASTSGSKGSSKALAENVSNFLNQVYYKMRNLGVSAEDRALNYAATNAFQVSSVFASALKENLELDDIVATKSPICRPGADCYDVVLTFFNPKERLTQARKQYRFTVDVSDIVPVTVGEVRSWSVY